jgi:peroxiredoxin
METALDFSLPAADGREVALAQLLRENHSVVLVFYRGFF